MKISQPLNGGISMPWLARFCQQDDYRPTWQQKVYSFPSGWSAAARSHYLLAVADMGVQEYPLPAVGEVREEAVRKISAIMKLPLFPEFETTISALWRWCEGIRGEECSLDHSDAPIWCVECGGCGWIVPQNNTSRAGRIAGLAVDRNKLCWLLAPELFDRYGGGPAQVCRTGRESLLCVRGKEWRAYLEGVDEQMQQMMWPPYYDDPLFLSLWEGREDDTTRLALADWLEERDDPYHHSLRI